MFNGDSTRFNTEGLWETVTEKDVFQCINEHLISSHRNNCLKYCKLELNEVSGSIAYGTKVHEDINPAESDIVVKTDNKVGIFRTDRSMF